MQGLGTLSPAVPGKAGLVRNYLCTHQFFVFTQNLNRRSRNKVDVTRTIVSNFVAVCEFCGKSRSWRKLSSEAIHLRALRSYIRWASFIVIEFPARALPTSKYLSRILDRPSPSALIQWPTRVLAARILDQTPSLGPSSHGPVSPCQRRLVLLSRL